MWDLIKADLFRYTGRDFTWRDFFFKLWIPGFRFTVLIRFCNKLNRLNPAKLFFLILYRYHKIKYGYQVPYQTEIGKGLYFSHFGGVVINSRATLGNNCNLLHNVTIGETNRGNKKGVPIIGNRVWIGTGSVIVGNIKIGNNVLISPNSFVNFDVPDDSIILTQKSKIISNREATKDYINRIVYEK